LNRSPKELERLIPLLDRRGVPVHCVTTGDLDLATATGRAMARFASTIANQESEHMGERVRRAYLDRALAGKPNVAKNRPYGYGPDFVTVVPAEARVIREMMRRFLAGESPTSIARDLNQRGVPTTGSLPWVAETVRRLLVSPRIAGWRQVPVKATTLAQPGAFLVPGLWKPIVPRQDVERAQAMFADDTIRPGSPFRHLLTGIIVCGGCSVPMSLIAPLSGKPRYSCSGGPKARPTVAPKCGHISIDQAFADDAVTSRLMDAVEHGLAKRALPLREDVAGDAEIDYQQMRARMGQLGTDFDSGLIDHEQWASRTNRLRRRSPRTINASKEIATHAELAAVARAPRQFRRRWPDLTRRAQRTLVRTLTTVVWVEPRTPGRLTAPPDPDRIQIVWRA
jgi:site-specific DNA recombinase